MGPKNAPRRQNPFLILIFLALVLAFFAVAFGDRDALFSSEKKERIPISVLLEKYKQNELSEMKVKESEIVALGKDGVSYLSTKEENANIFDLGFTAQSSDVKIEIVSSASYKMWINILIGVAPFVILLLFLMFLSRRASSMGGESGPFGFGKSRAKVYDKTKHQTKFSDVAGAQEAKEEVIEIVDFLKNPKKYHKMGAKIPKGVLLVGSPGTGKTLLARAIAGEADVPFFSVSGSEFVEMFVGVGASRVRDLFKTAKRNAPAIIFIDEIDAIGKQRGQGMGGGHDEREQTLNQILTEMDGFESDTSVIVLAATNRPDVLDKALLRPGRFDRRVHIDLPDMEARQQILEVHAKNKSLEKDLSLKTVASKTVGFSGADLENVMNEAAISVVKKRKNVITLFDIENAVEKVAMGPEKRSRRITDEERKIIAHHEVGHALAGHFSETRSPVHKISIISRGNALGVTWFLPEEDTYLSSEKKMFDELVSLHGGRMAEKIIFGQTTTGASSDLERISRIARSMVMTYGMGDRTKIGPVVFAEKTKGFATIDFHEKEYSDHFARLIDEEVQRLVLMSEEACEKILCTHLNLLKTIAKDLLQKENLSREEFLSYLSQKTS